jgi:hypothetical protein
MRPSRVTRVDGLAIELFLRQTVSIDVIYTAMEQSRRPPPRSQMAWAFPRLLVADGWLTDDSHVVGAISPATESLIYQFNALVVSYPSVSKPRRPP